MYNRFKRNLKQVVNIKRTDEIFLKTVLILGVIILGGSFVYNISQYNNIPDHWKVSISAFIIFLPFCYFLQALLNAKSYKEQNVSQIQSSFRELYLRIQSDVKFAMHTFVSLPSNQLVAAIILSEDGKIEEDPEKRPEIPEDLVYMTLILDDIKFRQLFQTISDLIKDVKLHDYYQKAFEIHTKREEELLDREVELIIARTYKGSPKEFQFLDEARKLKENISNQKAPENITEKFFLKRLKFLHFELEDIVDDIVEQKMHGEGISFRSYFLSLSFFLFIYFAGFLITLPLINSVFADINNVLTVNNVNNIFLPVFDVSKYAIPFQAIQWGFLGGFVYTSINLLNRFLRRDLLPRVYFYASFRLLLSSVVAIIIYFLYMLANPMKSGAADISSINPGILLLCFLAGVAPIQFLINFADSQMTRIYKGWRRRAVAGNRHITQISGIDSITAERLSEEGISSIQQLALINPREIQMTTKFPLEYISDWRDQAILYLLTADIAVPPPIIIEGNKRKKNKKSLYDYLGEKLSIRTMSSLLKAWNNITTNANPMKEELSFYKSLGLISNDGDDYISYHLLFNNIVTTGKSLYEQFELKAEASKPTQQAKPSIPTHT